MTAFIPSRSVIKLPTTIHTRNCPRDQDTKVNNACSVHIHSSSKIASRTHHNQTHSVLFVSSAGSQDGDHHDNAAHDVKDDETDSATR